MKKICVLVSGGGTNLQALIDAEKSGIIKNGKITCVISSKEGAYALERAKMQVSALSLFRGRNMLTTRVTARLFWLSLTDKVLTLWCWLDLWSFLTNASQRLILTG